MTIAEMTRWQDLVDAEPGLAARVHELFQARKHKTLATLRRDGSPRISGTETEFSDGDLWLGMMPGSMKALDLERDPRMALHSPSVDAPPGNDAGWPGEAKIAGKGVPVQRSVDGGPPATWIRVEVSEVVWTHLDPEAKYLVVESWHPGRGLEVRQRE
jgi:hypothetical protein